MYIYSLKEIIHYSDRFDITGYKWANLLGVSRMTVRHTLDGECFTKIKAIAMTAVINDLFLKSCASKRPCNKKKKRNSERKTLEIQIS